MSTWGQLRLILQTGGPGVPLDLIDSWLRERYTSVLNRTDWNGLKTHAMIQTAAAYQSAPGESVTLAVGSPNVAGILTSWTAAIIGRQFYKTGDNVVYRVVNVVSGFALTLDRPYEGIGVNPPATYPNSAYVLMTDIYPAPANARAPVTIINPVNGYPMEEFTKGGMDVSRGTRATVGDPWTWASYADSDEATPPVVQQVQFYPPPLRARGFEVQYLRDPQIFTGENTSASPLPFVTDRVLLEGVRADIATHLKDAAQSLKYEASFEKSVSEMLLVEHTENRKTVSLHMENRFTRHRMQRVDRQYGRGWGKGQGGPY